jgi:hypothetical protein
MTVLHRLLEEIVPDFLRSVNEAGLDVAIFAMDPFLCLFGQTLKVRAEFGAY